MRFAPAASAARTHAAGPLRSTPIVILPRRTQPLWAGLARPVGAHAAQPSSRAQAVLDHLREHGASFFDEIAQATRLLTVEIEVALGELVARGLIHADSFAGLRALLMPAKRRAARLGRQPRRSQLLGIEDAGRWVASRIGTADTGEEQPGSARPATTAKKPERDAVEAVARSLLRRYGVVCWRLLAREADWLPPWRELLRVLRQLEARGEIRGGRFIAGLSGEQFALAEAIPLLRKARARERNGELVTISATDPLNLVGVLDPGPRVAAMLRSRILYRDGVAVAASVSGRCTRLDGSEDALPNDWQDALTLRQTPTRMALTQGNAEHALRQARSLPRT